MEINFTLSKKEKNNLDVVLRLNDLVNNQLYEAMDDLFSADYRDHNPGWDISSVNDLKRIIADGHEKFDVHNEIIRAIPSDDMLFIEVVNHGVHRSEVFGCPPTGRETRMTTFEIYRFEKGKIVERWVVSDILGLMKQVGATIPVPL